ncbi:MAG: LemA family protein [Clostridiales bacterium]|nr:LemA family protein [Clostridiales bacterium]
MWISILVAVIAVLLIFYIKIYNRLQRLSVKVQEGSAGIDVALEKRYDMLSEEIESVKKYLAHEYQVYTEVTSTRAGKELNESLFQEKKQLSEEAVKTISETIAEQQKQMETIQQQLKQQRVQDGLSGEEQDIRDSKLAGHQMSLERKLGLLTSAQQGLTGVNSAINALAEQYPTLYSYASMQHFQHDIFDAEEHLQAARRLYNSNVSLYNQKIASFPYFLIAKLHGMKKANFYAVEEQKKDFKVQF